MKKSTGPSGALVRMPLRLEWRGVYAELERVLLASYYGGWSCAHGEQRLGGGVNRRRLILATAVDNLPWRGHEKLPKNVVNLLVPRSNPY